LLYDMRGGCCVTWFWDRPRPQSPRQRLKEPEAIERGVHPTRRNAKATIVCTAVVSGVMFW